MDVISRWVRAAMTGQPVEIYNSKNYFDYIFAGDVAEGLIRLSESTKAEGVVNLGSGIPRSVQNVVDILCTHFPGWRSLIKDLGTTERFEASCADLTKLKQTTNWTPKVDLEKGIQAIIQFELSQSKGEI
jgi:nucleoside-diphosphate-sugar epimerase